MTARYKLILGLVVIVGAVGLGWLCFVWAPKYAGGGAPDSIVKLNTIDKAGIPEADVVDKDGAKLSMASLFKQANAGAGAAGSIDGAGSAAMLGTGAAVGAGSGALTIVHFWASWCGPCVEEFPALVDFARANKGAHVIAIAEDSEIKDAVQFYSKFGVIPKNLDIVFDTNQEAAEKFGTEKLPESYTFCPSGKLLQKFGSAVNWNGFDFFSYVNVCKHDS